MFSMSRHPTLSDADPCHRVVRRSSKGATHIGRGGTGNVFTPAEKEAAEKELEKAASAIVDDQKKSLKTEEPGWAEKGKNFLFGKK